MDRPEVFETYRAAPDIDVLPAYFPIAGFGILPMNAFLIRTAEPVLVDAGLTLLRDEFMKRLTAIIDPAELKWLWLTHADQDHIGCLRQLLERAPGLKVITTFLGAGKMGLFEPLPMEIKCSLKRCLRNPQSNRKRIYTGVTLKRKGG